MVGLLSGECVLPPVVITYFDVNVGYVFNQVFVNAKKLLPIGASVCLGVSRARARNLFLVGASCARDFSVGTSCACARNLFSVGVSVFAWVFPAPATPQERVKVHPRMRIDE